jgi:hypothetical protein
LLQGEEFLFFVQDERAVQDEGTEWLGLETGHDARLPNPPLSQTDASLRQGKA